MRGEYERAIDEGHRTSDPFEARALGALGRTTEAIAAARREEDRFAHVPMLRGFSIALRAATNASPLLCAAVSEPIAALVPVSVSACTSASDAPLPSMPEDVGEADSSELAVVTTVVVAVDDSPVCELGGSSGHPEARSTPQPNAASRNRPVASSTRCWATRWRSTA